ncbi:hypothetical protein BDV96DRAFT_655207 [Lophiotrema nucula]|uniref:Mid2 domain-containing protein n=1 Tax=Lophiotrema nucula TaxID=690887 RepID=A0A6A5YFU5_9PLEO|nr:hypothetical protein BDV96DRAFT_655207 [Lophiotrema nucula]
MALLRKIFLLASALSLASSSPSPVEYTVRTHNAPGYSNRDTHNAIRREIVRAAALGKRNIDSNTTVVLDRSWDGATLLKIGVEKDVKPAGPGNGTVSGGVEVTCNTCYIKGKAKAQLRIDGDINATAIISQTMDSFQTNIENFTDTAENYFENYTHQVIKNLGDGIDASDFELPTFPYDFNLDIDAIPEALLRFQFDGLELYMQVDTTLSLGATYTISLYRSNTPVGLSLSKDLEVGVIFTIELVFAVESEITIGSGFHIQLEDGIAIEIPMFSNNVSDITFNGGQFEFLPVTIETAGVVLSAVLRIGVHAGVAISTPDEGFLSEFEVANITFPKLSGGIEVGVFANVAEFVTNVTVAPNDDKCELQVVQGYQMALGAAAGATVAFNEHVWGPVAETSIPIFYTTLADICAIKGKPTPTNTATPMVTARALLDRQETLETKTTSTEITLTGFACPSGKIICPVSEQVTTQVVTKKTLITAVPSDVDPTFPPSIMDTVTSLSSFGSNAVKMASTSGAPVSYVPPPPTSTSSTGDGNNDNNHIGALDGKVHGVDKKLIVGVSVGLGVPILLAIIGAIIFFQRKRKYAALRTTENTPMMGQTEYLGAQEPFREQLGKKPTVGVTVAQAY